MTFTDKVPNSVIGKAVYARTLSTEDDYYRFVHESANVYLDPSYEGRWLGKLMRHRDCDIDSTNDAESMTYYGGDCIITNTDALFVVLGGGVTEEVVRLNWCD